jgi:ABC-2 type transport system ATP-binding protein
VATRRLRFVTDKPDRPELSDLDGVTEVNVCGTGVSIDSLDADATIRDLVGRGVPFRDLEITGAGLEQAFVALTGCRGADTVKPATAAPAGTPTRGDK